MDAKLQILKDITVSYISGIAGGLVILFSLNNNSLQAKVFYFYLIVIYLLLILLVLFLFWLFREK